MNLSGRFTARELKSLGQQVLRLLLVEKDVDIFFGQQTVFRPSLPECFELVGTNKAFITYDKRFVIFLMQGSHNRGSSAHIITLLRGKG